MLKLCPVMIAKQQNIQCNSSTTVSEKILKFQPTRKLYCLPNCHLELPCETNYVIYTITIYPKQYWQVLNSLKKGDNSSKNPEIQVNFEKIIEHFKSQGSCKNYNVNLKNKVENHIIQCKNLLTENSITDKPFTTSEIKQCIDILKSNKSAGPDLYMGSGHYSDSPLLRRPIIPTAHCSHSPFLRQPIIPSKMVKSSIIILKPVVFLLYLTED